MLIIDVDPIAFHIGPVPFSWYGIMVVLAIVAVVALSAYRARSYNIKSEHIYAIALWAVFAGIVGAKLVHVVDQWDYYVAHPLDTVGLSGWAIYGAIIGAAAATLIYAWRKKLSFWVLGDIIAPGAVLGQAIGRVGCTLTGCCYGTASEAPWAVAWTNPGAAASIPLNEPVHPTQIYLLAWNLAVFGLLWALRKRMAPSGTLFLVYMALYAAGDFGIRFFRVNQVTAADLVQAQLIGIVVFVASVALLGIRVWTARRSTGHGEELRDPTGTAPGPERSS